MNDDEFVTYEQAVELKECGFNWCSDYYYVNEEFCVGNNPFSFEAYTIGSIISYAYVDDDNCDKVIPRITLSQAAKWLRESKGIHVVVEPRFSNYQLLGYDWLIYECSGDYSFRAPFPFSLTYENALSAGIDKALEIILNPIK